MGVKTLYEYFYKLKYGDKGIDKATLVNDCLDVADAQIKANKDGLTGIHTQGTDQGLDTGGENAVVVADVKDAVDKKHAQNTDTDLDATFKTTFVKKTDIVNVLSDITSPGANIEDAVTKKHANTLDHAQNTDTDLDATFEATLRYSNIVKCADYDHPDDAITAIDTVNKTLLVTEAETCDINFTVPANVSVKFERGGKWTINTGITVTFNGQIDAGLWQIFEYVGTGILIGSAQIDRIFPEWFGAKRDGTTDDSVAIQNMLDYAIVCKKMISFTAGTYVCTNLKLKANGDNGLIQGGGMERTILKNNAATPILTDNGQTYLRVTIKDIGLSGATGTGEGMKFTAQVYMSTFENIYGQTGGSFIDIRNENSCLFTNIQAYSLDSDVLVIQGGNTTTLINCYVHGVPAGKCGYRIYGSPTMISCNGIDGETTDQYWGIFGATIGEDGFTLYAHPTLINCNIENAFIGIRFKTDSYAQFIRCTIVAPALQNMIALYYDYNTNSPETFSTITFNKQGGTWANGYPIHCKGNAPFLKIGQTPDYTYWDSSVPVAYTVYGIGQDSGYLKRNIKINNPIFTTPTLGVASATSINFGDNALAAYKTGEWTIGISFNGGTTGITYSANTGYYTKIGNIVTISGHMVLTSKGTSIGDAYITGLPFTLVNNVAGEVSVSLSFKGITFANQLIGKVVKNTITIALQEVTEAGAVTNLTNADFANDSYIRLNCTYRCQ